MADQHRGARLQRNRALGGVAGLCERGERVLHAGAVDALLLQAGNHLRPARAIGKQPVHEHDIVRLQRRLRMGAVEQGKGGRGSSSSEKCATVHYGLLLE